MVAALLAVARVLLVLWAAVADALAMPKEALLAVWSPAIVIAAAGAVAAVAGDLVRATRLPTLLATALSAIRLHYLALSAGAEERRICSRRREAQEDV